jgi:tetratricopeptide (TPR) repeat protein
MRVFGFLLGLTLATAALARGEAEPAALLQRGLAAASKGDLEGAESALRLALAALDGEGRAQTEAERMQAVWGQNVLASLLQSRGQLEDAERLFRRSVSLTESHSGAQPWELADSLNLLAQLRLDRGDRREAASLASRALKLGEKGLGPRRSELARILNTLAEVRLQEGRIDDADALLRRADRLAELHDGSSALRASVAARRGLLRLATGDFHVAEPLLERSLDLAEAAYGEEHPALARILRPLADCYRLRNRLHDAQAMYERALALDEKTRGPSHADLVPTLTGLALVARRLEDRPRAEALYRRAAVIAHERIAADDPQRAACLRLLADFDSGRVAAEDPSPRVSVRDLR